MEKKIVIEYAGDDDASRNRRIAEILSGGVYDYLKAHGHLRKNPDRTKRIEEALDRSRRLLDETEE